METTPLAHALRDIAPDLTKREQRLILRSIREEDFDTEAPCAVANIRQQRNARARQRKLIAIYPRDGIGSGEYDYYWADYNAWDKTSCFFRRIAHPHYFR